MADADALDDALNLASTRGYASVVILLSTPGGSLDAMLRMITAIENSPLPVIAYVSPSGTAAWSAGTYILMASHLAAMAPNTVIGSCQPVSYSPLGSEPVNDSKIINAMIAVMATQARSHGRNETLAIEFITLNANVDDEAALSYGVVEYRAGSLQSLLSMVDGATVSTISGEVILNTEGAQVVEYSYRFRDSFVKIITDPTISSILFLMGVFGLIIGIQSPGLGGEIVGAVALILALVGMGFSVNIAAVVLMVIGLALVIYELTTPGFGAFGIGGVIILTLGALFIVPLTPENWLVAGDWYASFVATVLAVMAVISAFFIYIIIKIIQVRRRRPTVGVMEGDVAIASQNAPPNVTAFVSYRGEYWQGRSDTGLVIGKKYRIVGKEGPVLILKELQ